MNARALVAEFIGTLALIYIGVLAVVHLAEAPAGLTGIAFAHGLVIACLVSATAAISGGHLNPAVTVAMIITKRIEAGLGGLYMLAQLVGAAAGAFLACMSLAGKSIEDIVAGTPTPATGIDMGQAILVEAILTFFLVFVIFGTAVDKRAPKMAGLFIGLTIVFGILGGGPMTGAAINPARWFGPALISGDLKNLAIYFIGPILGAVIAALLYESFLIDKEMLAPGDPKRVDATA